MEFSFWCGGVKSGVTSLTHSSEGPVSPFVCMAPFPFYLCGWLHLLSSRYIYPQICRPVSQLVWSLDYLNMDCKTRDVRCFFPPVARRAAQRSPAASLAQILVLGSASLPSCSHSMCLLWLVYLSNYTIILHRLIIPFFFLCSRFDLIHNVIRIQSSFYELLECETMVYASKEVIMMSFSF